jgi:hypothetical protein
MNPNRWIWLAMALVMAPAHADDDLSKLAWLGGCWRSESGDVSSVEHWLPLAGGTMLGVSRTVRGGETVAYEFMQIRTEVDGLPVFVAQPSGRPPTLFPLVRISTSEAVFENPEHDFPQRIVYSSKDGDRLDARIEGVRNGERRAIDFPMSRTSCDAHGSTRR